MVFYRENAADIQLSIDDALALPLEKTKLLEIAGTNLSKEPSRSACLFAAERAKTLGCKVVLDLDFRADQWHDPRAFGLNIRAILPLVDIAIGTEEEVNAAMLSDPKDLLIKDQQMSDPEVKGDLNNNIATLLSLGLYSSTGWVLAYSSYKI